MEEKILTGRKNGMIALIVCVIVGIASIVGSIFGAIIMETTGNWLLFVPCIIIACVFWFPLCGLKVLRPQEALVLTLFGKYIGTLKGEGFYCVNPFCIAVNFH